MKIILTEKQIKHLLNEQINEQHEKTKEQLKSIKPLKKISNYQGLYRSAIGAFVNLYIGEDNKFYSVDINDPDRVWLTPHDSIKNMYNTDVLILADKELRSRGINPVDNKKTPNNKKTPVNKTSNNKTPAINKTNPKEQQWLGIWEKFLVKYYGFTGGDTTNKTTLLDKKVYEFIVKNKHLYNKNKNLNKLNLLIDGIFGSVHESFIPPYYTVNNTFPIYFYQKSNVIKNIQKKLGIKQTGVFLTLTENAIIKRLNFKKTPEQGFNVTYNRKTGVTKEIYDVIMSQDTKNLNTDVKPIERNINPNNIIQPTNMNNPEIK
jgi:hypothetical protein